MLWFSKKIIHPIGVEVGAKTLKLAQISESKDGMSLIASESQAIPADINPGSIEWQKWTIDAIKKLSSNNFVGKNVIASMLQNEVFISHVKIPKAKEDNLQEAIIAKVKHKLPFAPEKAILKYIAGENENYLVIASEKEKISRQLAIFEKANLNINSIGVWPTAMTTSYINFFGRRKSDIEKIVMLLDIEKDHTNIVICRHKNVLFARTVPMGVKASDNKEHMMKLALELTSCKQYFDSMSLKSTIERLVFLCSSSLNEDMCQTIAKQLEMPAQIGNCLAAVNFKNTGSGILDRRNNDFNWTTAFGLSLQSE